MIELFKGVQSCNTCKHYKNENGHRCIKNSGELTETARLKSRNCHEVKK